MSKKYYLYLLLGALMALLISGCKCTQEQMWDLVILHDTPADGTLISSLLPSFSWHSTSCSPSYYYVSLHENGDDYLYNEYDQAPDDETSFDWLAPPLEPGKEYAWHVIPVLVDPGYMSGYASEETIFYTGPVCSGETLVAPELQIPRYPYWVNTYGPQEFNWTYPGSCLPEHYDYQFASDPGFTDIILSGTTTELYAQHMYQTFPNCSSVFWRVAANDGSTVGPWSDAEQFHWVEDTSCWQNHYISDDAARINVRLYHDVCDQTGYSVFGVSSIHPGCVEGKGGIIHGDGERIYPDHGMYNFTVDLGSGPCPSTGLDSKKFESYDFFYVVAPGTYCVSISKDQTVEAGYLGPLDLNDGRWTDPATTGLVAEETVELGPGLTDVYLQFGWDEYERLVLWYPFPENYWCRRGREPICDPLKLIPEGFVAPILARDAETEWKQTFFEGELCYVYLPAVQIDEAQPKVEGAQLLTANLAIFEPPPPCPTPTPEPRQPGQPGQPEQPERNCSQYKDPRSCEQAGCQWVQTATSNGYCAPK